MNPIKIKVHSIVDLLPKEICSIILDTSQWIKFEGYSFLPGIEKAKFEKRTAAIVGSRIKVHNKDGSTHIEEIIEWDENRKVVLKFQEFNSPLKKFASYFIEEWNFTVTDSGTEILRTIKMYPINLFGLILLKPISILMKKALKNNLEMLNQSSIQ